MKNKFYVLYALIICAALGVVCPQSVLAGEDDIWGGGESSWSDKVQDPAVKGHTFDGYKTEEKTYATAQKAFADPATGADGEASGSKTTFSGKSKLKK